MEKKIFPNEAALINKVAAKYGYEPVEPKEYDEGPDAVAEAMTFTVGEKWDAIDIVVVRLFQDGFDPTWVVALHDACGSENNWLDGGLNEKDLEECFAYYVENYIEEGPEWDMSGTEDEEEEY